MRGNEGAARRVARAVWALAVTVALAAVVVACGREIQCHAPQVRYMNLCVVPCDDLRNSFCYPDGGRVDADLSEVAAGDGGAGACGEGGVGCGAACVDTSRDPQNCGACGRTCPGATGGRATCASGVCDFECLAGRHRCGGACVEDSSPATCGASCMPCVAPAGADATCAAGACGWACRAGFDRMGAGCDARPPRQVAPLSTAVVTSQRPELRWELAAGTDGATVEICRERACATVVQTIDATGSRAMASSALTAGVWFWRLRGRGAGAVGTRTSAVWQFTVGHRSAPVNSSYGSVLDVNGDGYSDSLVGSMNAMGTRGRAHVYFGSVRGLATSPSQTIEAPDGERSQFGVDVASAGDVNGDGYGDAVVGALGVQVYAGRAYVFLGGPTGLATTPAVSLSGRTTMLAQFGARVGAAGDVNGDGFADVYVCEFGSTDFTPGSRVYVYAGSRDGIGRTPARVLVDPGGPTVGGFGLATSGAGDFNGDGFADLVAGSLAGGGGDGQAHVYLGSRTGVGAAPDVSLAGVPGSREYFGGSVASALDVNGDGLNDLVVGASEANGRAGRVVLYPGAAGGVGHEPLSIIGGPDGPDSSFGVVSAMGDVDGDGFGDVAVGAPRAVMGRGRVHVYFGGTAGLDTMVRSDFENPMAMSTSPIGAALAGAADVNGDGFSDVGVSAGGGAPIGWVYWFHGGTRSMASTPTTTLVGPDGEGASYGNQIASYPAVRRRSRVAVLSPRAVFMVDRRSL